jgi:biotin carboxyl carrier protein
LLRALCDEPAVIEASYGTATLEAFARTWQPSPRRSAAARPRTAERRMAPRLGALGRGAAAAGGNTIPSPMHGLIVELRVGAGDRVAEGDVVAVIEAMKMMNEIRAHRGGTVDAVLAGVGASVERGSPLISFQDDKR